MITEDLNSKKLAPIVLFTYNRLEETKQTLDNLKKCKLANKSNIYIYSDGAKTEDKKSEVLEIREFLSSITGFKNIELICSDTNKGLAKSIIKGVTEVLDRYGKVIVLEDDLIVSEDFLEYMNSSLETYENREDIWSISGYGPDINIPENYKENIYLTLRGCSWGWATWDNRWKDVDWEVRNFHSLKKNKVKINQFNISGNDMFKMLELQMMKKINSWAIRWCYSQFEMNKYTVYPVKSKVKNIGFGKKATHGGIFIDKHLVEISSNRISINENIKISEEMMLCFKKHNDLNFYSKIGYFLKKNNLGYNLAKKILKVIKNRNEYIGV